MLAAVSPNGDNACKNEIGFVKLSLLDDDAADDDAPFVGVPRREPQPYSSTADANDGLRGVGCAGAQGDWTPGIRTMGHNLFLQSSSRR